MKVLDGVKVIDFTHAYAGPFCTLNLADFGAEVIKIEKSTGDQARFWGPFKNNYSGYYASFNRGKKSITLDITSEEGKKIIFDLVKNSDIVCSNFKTGTLEKYGIGYDEMKKIKPDIIYATISGFGNEGALSKLPAYDNVIQAMSGIMDVTGFPDGIPTKIGPAIGDSFAGLILLLGVTIAYYNKLNTGKGQKVDVTMLGSLFSMLEKPILEYTSLSNKLCRMGNFNPYKGPNDTYKVKCGFVTIGVNSEEMWVTFCNVIGSGLINDIRFRDNNSRVKNQKELKEIIEKHFESKTKEEVTEQLESLGIPCAPVLNIKEAFNNPQLKARDMIVELDDPGTGKIKLVGNPIKLSKTPPEIKKPSPLLGQDTVEILESMGYSSEEIQDLRINKVI
ncbi:CaiB/BaiF CoA transferase family protein [Clostridium sp.]